MRDVHDVILGKLGKHDHHFHTAPNSSFGKHRLGEVESGSDGDDTNEEIVTAAKKHQAESVIGTDHDFFNRELVRMLLAEKIFSCPAAEISTGHDDEREIHLLTYFPCDHDSPDDNNPFTALVAAGMNGGGEIFSLENHVKIVNQAGGIASIAHAEKYNLKEIESFINLGVNALAINAMDSRAKVKLVYEMVEKRGVGITFGSDYHGDLDAELGGRGFLFERSPHVEDEIYEKYIKNFLKTLGK